MSLNGKFSASLALASKWFTAWHCLLQMFVLLLSLIFWLSSIYASFSTQQVDFKLILVTWYLICACTLPPQMQNNVYELVSDINTRQALIDEKVLTLEERLLMIHEQIEQMPDLIKKTLTSNQQRSSLPTLVENIMVSNQDIQVPTCSYNIPSYQHRTPEELQQQAKHTYLHPNDAACLVTRPSWSTSNINTSMTGSNPNYSNAKQYLTPNVLRTTSFDTWAVQCQMALSTNVQPSILSIICLIARKCPQVPIPLVLVMFRNPDA